MTVERAASSYVETQRSLPLKLSPPSPSTVSHDMLMIQFAKQERYTVI
jgi:hypothetical protein